MRFLARAFSEAEKAYLGGLGFPVRTWDERNPPWVPPQRDEQYFVVSMVENMEARLDVIPQEDPREIL